MGKFFSYKIHRLGYLCENLCKIGLCLLLCLLHRLLRNLHIHLLYRGLRLLYRLLKDISNRHYFSVGLPCPSIDSGSVRSREISHGTIIGDLLRENLILVIHHFPINHRHSIDVIIERGVHPLIRLERVVRHFDHHFLYQYLCLYFLPLLIHQLRYFLGLQAALA